MADAVNALSNSPMVATGTTTPVRLTTRSYDFVWAKNAVGGALIMGNVVRLSNADSYDVATFPYSPTMVASTPTAGLPWGVVLDPIAVNGYGRVLQSGVIPMQLNVSLEAHKYVTVGASVWAYSAISGEAEILWKETGTGTKWALVRYVGRQVGTALSPADLPATGATAATNYWALDTPPTGKDGFKIDVPLRIYWDGVNTHPIYQYTRTMLFDSTGRLVNVSHETQSVAFNTTACD